MLKKELIFLYNIKQIFIKDKLQKQINSHGGFSLTLNVWTAIN